jgi:hypothetical protein
MSDDDLTPAERAEIERMHGVLADPAVWAEPPLDLQERVVAAIAEEAATRRRLRRIGHILLAAAAAVVLVAGITIGFQATRDEPVQFTASLAGTRLAPDAVADVTLTKTDSGWKIELHATGLPRRTDGEFYQAWLKNDAGRLVPIGTFNEGADVTLWSGVGPGTFPTLTITEELADDNQASSGQVVLVGQASES